MTATSGESAPSNLCVECVRLVGVERAEWAAVYRGGDGYCPDHLPTDSVIESLEALELDENRLREALLTTCPACDADVPVGGMRRHLDAEHSGRSGQ